MGSKHHHQSQRHHSSRRVQQSPLRVSSHNGQSVLPPPHAPSVLARHSPTYDAHSLAGGMSLNGQAVNGITYLDAQSIHGHGNGHLGHLGHSGHGGHSGHNNGTLRSSVDMSIGDSTIDDRRGLTSDQARHREMAAHEIKFTKTESCTPGSCLCLMVAIMLILVGATSGLYYGLRGYNGRTLKERVFKGRLIITRGEPYQAAYERQRSDEFRELSKKYKEKFNKLFNTSHFAKAYKTSEVIALEKAREGADDLEVHFNLHFSPRIRPELNAADLYLVLATELVDHRRGLFKNVSVDHTSLDIAERRDDSYSAVAPFYVRRRDPWEARTRFPGLLEGLSTEPTPPPRKCSKITLSYCSEVLPYNETGYPNLLGHWNMSSLEANLVNYRQIVDAECHSLAHEFVCLISQPECVDEDVLIWPCRDFCEDFKRSCSNWMSTKVADTIKCKEFPKEGEELEDRTLKNSSNDEKEGIEEVFVQKKSNRVKCRKRPHV